MRICEKCHGSLKCDVEHPHKPLGLGDQCGVCSGRRTDFECQSPAAQEIHFYNLAVATFTLTMRAKFIENMNDKGGWQEIGYGYAIKRLNHEAGELAEALLAHIKGPSELRAIADEAADVSNFAMFICNLALGEDSRNRSIQKHTDTILKRLEDEKTGVGAK